MIGALENTLNHIEQLNVNYNQNAWEIRGYKLLAIPIAIGAVAQSILLLPLQIAGKPLAFIAVSIFSWSTCCQQFYKAFPEHLTVAALKIIGFAIACLSTATIGLISSETNYDIHVDLRLIHDSRTGIAIQQRRLQKAINENASKLRALSPSQSIEEEDVLSSHKKFCDALLDLSRIEEAVTKKYPQDVTAKTFSQLNLPDLNADVRNNALFKLEAFIKQEDSNAASVWMKLLQRKQSEWQQDLQKLTATKVEKAAALAQIANGGTVEKTPPRTTLEAVSSASTQATPPDPARPPTPPRSNTPPLTPPRSNTPPPGATRSNTPPPTNTRSNTPPPTPDKPPAPSEEPKAVIKKVVPKIETDPKELCETLGTPFPDLPVKFNNLHGTYAIVCGSEKEFILDTESAANRRLYQSL